MECTARRAVAVAAGRNRPLISHGAVDTHSHALGRFVDLDQDIEAQQNLTIAEIFDARGEAEFRRIESEALGHRVRAIGQGAATVMALGGGAFAQDVNFQLVSEYGVAVWLDCPAETAWRRVAETSHRPLARDREKFLELYAERRDFYARADGRVEIASDDPAVAVDAILGLLKLA